MSSQRGSAQTDLGPIGQLRSAAVSVRKIDQLLVVRKLTTRRNATLRCSTDPSTVLRTARCGQRRNVPRSKPDAVTRAQN